MNIGSVVLIGYSLYASSYFAADYMSISDAEKKWGTLTLNTEQFKSGDLSKRAPMAVDIVKRSLYVGKSRKDIRRELASYIYSRREVRKS